MAKCPGVVTVYSRVTGYFQPVVRWNPGKFEEFKERMKFDKSIKEATADVTHSERN